jgi:hypothetical protein
VRVDGLADVHCVCAHLDRQRNLANHVARVGADHAAAEDFSMAARFGTVVKQQFGDAFVAPLAMARPDAAQGNRPFLTLMPWALAWSSVRPTQATSGSV